MGHSDLTNGLPLGPNASIRSFTSYNVLAEKTAVSDKLTNGTG